MLFLQLEGEKNKLENLLQNNLMKKRDRILTDIQEESNQTNQEKLDSSGSELEAVDQRIAELKTQVKGSCIQMILNAPIATKVVCYSRLLKC